MGAAQPTDNAQFPTAPHPGWRTHPAGRIRLDNHQRAAHPTGHPSNVWVSTTACPHRIPLDIHRMCCASHWTSIECVGVHDRAAVHDRARPSNVWVSTTACPHRIPLDIHRMCGRRDTRHPPSFPASDTHRMGASAAHWMGASGWTPINVLRIPSRPSWTPIKTIRLHPVGHPSTMLRIPLDIHRMCGCPRPRTTACPHWAPVK